MKQWKIEEPLIQTVWGGTDKSKMLKMQRKRGQDSLGQGGGHVRHGRPCDHLQEGWYRIRPSVYASLKLRSIREEATAGAGSGESSFGHEAEDIRMEDW